MVNKIFIAQQMTDSPIYYLLDIKGAEDNFTFILADQMSKCWAERMNGGSVYFLPLLLLLFWGHILWPHGDSKTEIVSILLLSSNILIKPVQC